MYRLDLRKRYPNYRISVLDEDCFVCFLYDYEFIFPSLLTHLLLLSLHIWSERDAPRYVTPTLELGRVFKYQLRIFLEKQQN